MWAVCQQGRERVVCILALWKLCGFCGIVCGLPVDFWWQVNTLLEMGVLEAQDGAVVVVVRLLPPSLASGPLTIIK